MKPLVCAAALAVTVAWAASAQEPSSAPSAGAEARMPTPPPEMKVEKWFAGVWTCKGTQHAGPMGPEMKILSRLEGKMDLGGSWLQIRGRALSGPMKGKEMFEGFATFNGTAHDRFDFQPGGYAHLTSKGWEGDKLVFEGDLNGAGGAKTALRHTITRKGEGRFESVFESDGKPLVQETCTRAGGERAGK